MSRVLCTQRPAKYMPKGEIGMRVLCWQSCCIFWCYPTMASLVPRLSRAPCMKNSLVTIVDFLGPKSNYPAGIRAGQSDCTEDNFSMRDTRMSACRVIAALDPCSNLVKCGLQAYSESIQSPTTLLGSRSQTLMQNGRNMTSLKKEEP